MFQFTHPGRGATRGLLRRVLRTRCFNSRTPGGVRLSAGMLVPCLVRVSIHAPREGCDEYVSAKVEAICNVSIHAPREGCDIASTPSACSLISFNSRTPGGVRQVEAICSEFMRWFQFTHPGRGATRREAPAVTPASSFNSRTPGGVRPTPSLKVDQASEFQFTHPGRGATTRWKRMMRLLSQFQFTHPGRGATW